VSGTIAEEHARKEFIAIPRTRKALPGPDQVLDLIETTLEDDKADAVVVIPLANKSTIADHMVIASGRSTRHVASMAEHILERLKKAGLKGVAAEGRTQCDWVLIDGGDVIVHLFRPEVRAFYNLEKMWQADLPDGGELSAAYA
jgi:ribosome-associated protein